MQRREERPREGVADERHLVDALALDRSPGRVRVEAPHLVGEDDGAAAVEGVERRPLPGAVHEGRQHEEAAAEPRVDVAEELLLAVEPLEPRHVAAEPIEEDVLVPPEDPLRHARRAAGEQHVEVVGGVGELDRVRALGGEPCFVVDGAGQERVVRVVAHLDEVAERRQPVAHRRQQRGERRMVDDRARGARLQDVVQLIGDVAIVDVHERSTRLPRPVHRLDPLVAVVAVDGDVVVARLPRLEVRSLATTAEAEAQEGAAELARARGEVRVGEDTVPPHEGLPVGHVAPEQLLDGGEVHEHQYGSPLLCRKLKSAATNRSTSG